MASRKNTMNIHLIVLQYSKSWQRILILRYMLVKQVERVKLSEDEGEEDTFDEFCHKILDTFHSCRTRMFEMLRNMNHNKMEMNLKQLTL